MFCNLKFLQEHLFLELTLEGLILVLLLWRCAWDLVVRGWAVEGNFALSNLDLDGRKLVIALAQLVGLGRGYGDVLILQVLHDRLPLLQRLGRLVELRPVSLSGVWEHFVALLSAVEVALGVRVTVVSVFVQICILVAALDFSSRRLSYRLVLEGSLLLRLRFLLPGLTVGAGYPLRSTL